MRKVLALIVTSTLLGACTQSKGDESVDSVAGTVPSNSISEPTDTTPEYVAPTGEPFVIGVVNTEGAPGTDFPEFSNAFRAAAAYVNAELGGIGGRPGELEVCL